MAEVRIAKSAFLTEVNGVMIGVRKGMIVDAAHPVLEGREDLFARPEDCIELALEKADDLEPEKGEETSSG